MNKFGSDYTGYQDIITKKVNRSEEEDQSLFN